MVWLFLLMGLSFYVAAFPFHTWFADALEGPPTPSSSFISVATRAGGLVAWIRVLTQVFGTVEMDSAGPARHWTILGQFDWTGPMAVLVAFSLLIGPVLALGQTSGRRMIATLALTEAGFSLLGILVLDQEGLSAVLYSFFVSLVGLMGALFVLQIFIDRLGSDALNRLRGAFQANVPESIALVLCLCALIGLPPMPGFVGKFALLGSAVDHEWYGLAAAGVAAIALNTLAAGRLIFSLMGGFATQTVAAGSPLVDERVWLPTPARVRGQRLFMGLFLFPLITAAIFSDALFRLLERATQGLMFP
jgi:NADH-quinone oxidoreductase subunit N